MSGVGRGAILRKMMDSTQLPIEDINPPLHPFKCSGFLAPFGRGTSLMTPSQFMKSTSSTLAKGASPTQIKNETKANDVTPTPKEDLSCEETNKIMFQLTMHKSDDNSEIVDEANVRITKENVSTEVQNDTNEKHKISTTDAGHVPNSDTRIDMPKLNTNLDIHDNESTTVDEIILTKCLDRKKGSCTSVMTSTSNTSNNVGENFASISEQKPNAVGIFFAIPEQKATHELHAEESLQQGKVKDFSPAVESKEQTEERNEDEKWKLYKVERKIDKVIKNLTLNNLGDMFEELECLIEERPLSSVYINCSEVQLLLEALMKNAVQNAEFLPLAPCLIKMVSEHQPIEFKQYFPEICDAKCQEYVTLSASDEYLNKNGQHFCKLLGHLFAMPRQTGPILFNTISTVVGEYVEQWTCPEGSEVVLDGLQAYRLAIEATAVRCLLLEITHKMLSCDKEVETEMEKFVWFMRESVLNAEVPKKVREIYLDGLIDIQTASSDGSSTSASASAYGVFMGTNSQSESEADVSFETDINGDERVKIDDCCDTDMEKIKSEEIKSETDNSVAITEKDYDKFKFETLGNPPIDTIAMAPRIENAYDSSATIPKSSKACIGGFAKMAMTFGNQPMWTNKLQDMEDDDDDVIIEDEGNYNIDPINDKMPDSDRNIIDNADNDDNDAEKSSSITNDTFVCNKNINKSQNNNPFISSLPPKKKLPLGRGRGLARLPDFGGGSYSEKPVANVNPIGYSSCEATNRSRNPDNAIYPREEGSNTSSGADSMRPHRSGWFTNNTRTYNSNDQFGDVSNNDSKTVNFQQQRMGGINNDTRTEPFHRRRGGGCNNDIRTDHFQNHRGGGSGNRGNNSNRNGVNFTQGNNMCWREKKKFKNDNQKSKKANFRPVNHKKNTIPKDDQFSVGNSADSTIGKSKTEELEKFYHPNGRLEYRSKPRQKQEFGSVIPNACLRCNSSTHIAEQCPVDNMFF